MLHNRGMTSPSEPVKPPPAATNRVRSKGAVVLAAVASLGLIGTACGIRINTDSGDLVAKTFEIEDFNELEIVGAFDVDVDVGPEPSLEVEADEDSFNDIQIDQSGDRLVIEIDDGWFSVSGPIRIQLTTPALDEVDLSGAVSVDISNIDGEVLDLNVEGASTVTADGEVTRASINLEGASTVDFDDLIIDEVVIDAEGASSADLNGAASVTGSLSGASSVDVADDASVNVRTAGASSIG